MADPKSVTTLQSVKITCSEINDETLKMRRQFDAWLDKSRTALDVR